MRSGRRDLECPPRGTLPGDLGQIGARLDRDVNAGHRDGRRRPNAAQPGDHLGKRLRRANVDACHERCLGCIARSDDNVPDARTLCRDDGRQHAPDRAQPPVQTEFGDPRGARDRRRWDGPGRRQHCQGHGQVEGIL